MFTPIFSLLEVNYIFVWVNIVKLPILGSKWVQTGVQWLMQKSAILNWLLLTKLCCFTAQIGNDYGQISGDTKFKICYSISRRACLTMKIHITILLPVHLDLLPVEIKEMITWIEMNIQMSHHQTCLDKSKIKKDPCYLLCLSLFRLEETIAHRLQHITVHNSMTF